MKPMKRKKRMKPMKPKATMIVHRSQSRRERPKARPRQE